MEFIQEVVNFMALAVKGFGAGAAVVGLIDFSEGRSQNNAGKKEEGMNKMMGGGIIFLVGQILVPKLINFFTTL